MPRMSQNVATNSSGAVARKPDRRDFVQVGVCGALGLSLGQYLQMSSARADQKFYETKEGRAKTIIQIVLPGGMAQQESWDPKPEAPVEYRGPFGVAKTNVAGVLFSENFKNVARLRIRPFLRARNRGAI